MKSCIFHKKYLLAGIYIIFVLFTCCNSRFYHTPLAKICSVTEKQTLSREGTRGSKEYYYTQNITARILNGSHKGEKITVSNEYTSSQVQTKKYHKGDTVLLSGSKESPGKTIRSVKRDGYLALLAGGLFFLLICITGKQGFYTIISLILNTVIFAYGFQAFTEGKNILNICNVIAVLFSLTTLICLNGIHRKTFSSVLSTLCVLFLIMALFEFSIYMYGDLDYSNLEYLGSTGNSADIFWADIMLTGLGAIMDVTVTISAAVGEIVRKNPSVSLKRLIHSGREIGYDIMGTMINVLLFVLASGMIPMFILKMNNDISFITIVRYHIPYDICRFLIESIGIVLAIPVSVFIASAIMKIPSRKGVSENDHFSCIDFNFSGDLDWRRAWSHVNYDTGGEYCNFVFFNYADVCRFSCTAPDIGGRCRCLLYFSVLSERK